MSRSWLKSKWESTYCARRRATRNLGQVKCGHWCTRDTEGNKTVFNWYVGCVYSSLCRARKEISTTCAVVAQMASHLFGIVVTAIATMTTTATTIYFKYIIRLKKRRGGDLGYTGTFSFVV